MELDHGLRSFLKVFLLPPGSLLLILLLGLATIRRRLGRILVLLGTGGFWVLSLPVTANWLAMQVETVAAQTPAALKASGAGAILVLLADQRRENPEYGGAARLSSLSLERLDYGLYLHDHTGLPLLLSGGAMNEGETPLSVLGERWVKARSQAPIAAIEARSMSTWENLVFTRDLVRKQDGPSPLVLVTHAFHMPRALRTAGAIGLQVTPAPFGFIRYDGDGPTEPGDWMPSASSLGHSYLLLHEILGGYWYRLREYLA